ncbi:unnamed protein product [Rhizophagus irregularis]|nr:unnamed protein product [Rhizophagus irregularis]
MMDSDQESTSSFSSSFSTYSSSSLSDNAIHLNQNMGGVYFANHGHRNKISLITKNLKIFKFPPFLLTASHMYRTIKKEVFIWVDSELKDIYEIDSERTWLEQKENIITKLLLLLYKLVNKKYNVSNSDILKMLHGRWRSRHHVSNIKKQGDDKVKMDRRRLKKNSRTMDIKKKRRAQAANYLIENNDKYIRRYPEKVFIRIFKVQRCKTTTSMPPVDTPNWCLTDEALKRFNRSTNEIPTYDYNTDQDKESDEYHNDEYENKKRKNKKNKKSKKRG